MYVETINLALELLGWISLRYPDNMENLLFINLSLTTSSSEMTQMAMWRYDACVALSLPEY